MLAPLEAAASSLTAGLPGRGEVFFEVPLAAGVPDMVVAAFDAAVVTGRHAAGLGPVVDVAGVRTLVALTAGVTDVPALAVSAGLSVGYLQRTVLPVLADAGWVATSRGAPVCVLHRFEPVVVWAVTVEAKRSAWAQAAAQAQRHVAAADRAFIAMDAAHARRAVDHAGHLAGAGVGVVTVRADPDGALGTGVDVVAYPKPGRPRLPRAHRAPNVVAKTLLGERVWDLALDGRRHGPTHLVFGRDLSIA